jgi:hypothetical protein
MNWERHPALREHPHFQRMLHFDGNGRAEPVAGDECFLGSLTWPGISHALDDGSALLALGGLLFRTGETGCTAIDTGADKREHERIDTHQLSACASGVLAFHPVGHRHRPLARFRCGKRGRNFGAVTVRAFGDHLLAYGDGYWHLLRLKPSN